MESLEQFKALVQLALVDNDFEDKEKEFIFKIAEMYDVPNGEINKIISSEMSNGASGEIHFESEDDNQKFEYLVNLIKLMKADGEIVESELRYCEEAGKSLGFDKSVVKVLVKIISSSSFSLEAEELREDIDNLIVN